MTCGAGPLAGYRVLEIGGLGAAPFCAMMLADMGADVVRVERAGTTSELPPMDAAKNVLHRGRRRLALDLKRAADVEALLSLTESAHVLLEGYRPGVMERLGLGPDVCRARNKRLVYARLTGWGQDGPMAARAGHDINYFGLSGALWLCGRAGERPSPNLNMVADMGGGGMLAAFGIVCALLEAVRSGEGQVIDAAMTEGVVLLSTQIHALRAMGLWADERGANLLDGGAPFYDVYETADSGFMAVGAIEGKFYRLLLEGLGIDPADAPRQHDRASWAETKRRFAEIFATRTRAEWEAIFAGTDACVTPVLTPDEAAAHPHFRARQAFASAGGVRQPMPAPRFSRTPAASPSPPPTEDLEIGALIREWT